MAPSDNDEGGVMVMCDDCRVWQHTACMMVPEEAIPENYFCEQCRPDLHTDLLRRVPLLYFPVLAVGLPLAPRRHSNLVPPNRRLGSKKVRRPRRRSSATRILTRDTSTSPAPNSMLQKPKSPKRRLTMNSHAAAYDELLAAQASKQERHEDEEEDPLPIMYVGPKPRKRKRSTATSVPDPERYVLLVYFMYFNSFIDVFWPCSAGPPAKRPRSNSVASEQRTPLMTETPAPILEEPADPPPEQHLEEEPTPAPAPPPRGKRGAGAKKGAKAIKAPTPLPEVEAEGESICGARHMSLFNRLGTDLWASETPVRPPPKAGKQPNQYSGRKAGAHSPVKRGASNAETSKRNAVSNSNKDSNKNTRASSPAGLLTTWHLPEHLQHLKDLLPSDIPKPLDVRIGPGVETTQERGVKVKWPTKRMTIGDMNKRVRNLLEYVSREQTQLQERHSRAEALDTAIKEGRYKPVIIQNIPMEMEVVPVEEDVKPDIEAEKEPEPAEENEGPRTRSSVAAAQPIDPNNPIVQWCSLSTEQMLEDLLTEVLAFREKYTYRPKAKRQNGVLA